MDEQEQDRAASGISRRSALGLGGLALAGAAAGAVGVTLGAPARPASAHGTLAYHDEIWYAPTIWDGTGVRRGDYYNATFYSHLETWLQFFFNNSSSNWYTPFDIKYAGVHVDKSGSCAGMSSSCHSYGRAFDLRHIVITNANTGQKSVAFNARYDQWGPGSGTVLKNYWATVASLDYHFTYVLHYLYAADTSHRNHVHIDNGVSGTGLGTFSTGRSTQVQSAQAGLRYIWGYSTTIDGEWGPQTDSQSRAVLTRIGRSGGLTTSATNWREFNKATFRKGTWTQSY